MTFFFKNQRVQNYLMYLFFVLSAVSCFATYLLFSDVDSYRRNSGMVISLLYFDIICILLLLLLGSQKLLNLWSSRHSKGSRLTLRLISTFSIVAVVPSIMMCIFSALFFHNGVESWFNKRNQTVLQESLSVAESYLTEHKRNAISDCVAISKTLEYHIEKIYSSFEDDPIRLSKNIGFLLDDLCGLKDVDAAILLDSYLNVVAHSKYSVALHFLNVDYKKLKEIEISDRKCLILETNDSDENIITASCFENLDETMYLITEKKINSNILSQAKNTRIAHDEYFKLLEERRSLEIAFIFMFLAVGILLLIASIAVAIVYSWRIVKPVSNLIDVSESIIDGNMNARANEDGSYEEIRLLSKTFNQMVEQVSDQRKDLQKINKELDEKMKFTGSVLAGVSSGVIGIHNNTIFTWNTAAENLLGADIAFGERISDVFPEVKELLKLIDKKTTSVQREIQFKKGNDILLFSVKIENITSRRNNRFVITFNDMTDIVAAQRKAAWSDVARRVAHEIKNPLTPIQLSAERMRRKYLPQITADRDIFSELINVIIRQVGDIKRLIDEFNFFARLPEPNSKECDLYDVCRQAVLLMQNAGADVEVIFLDDGKKRSTIRADERLLHQSVVNLIQNAIGVLSTVDKTGKKVWVHAEQRSHHMVISVEDNGPGLPREKIELLTTPYFTLMPKGTGLGLAIVKKIVQDHRGRLTFGESVHGGAKVTMFIPFEGKK